jgi:hypothetical protein
MNDRSEPVRSILGEKASSHEQDTGKDHRGPTRTEATMKRHARGPDRPRPITLREGQARLNETT